MKNPVVSTIVLGKKGHTIDSIKACLSVKIRLIEACKKPVSCMKRDSIMRVKHFFHKRIKFLAKAIALVLK